MSRQTIDVVIVAWPVSPARLDYCIATIDALQKHLRAEGHQLEFMVSIGQEQDPNRRWCGDELIEYLGRVGIRYEWRSRERESLGYAMNEAIALSTSPYLLLVQDDAVLLRPLDLSPGINLMEEVPKIDIIRYGWSNRRGFYPSSNPSGKDGWRSIDRERAWPYSDNPHMRRSTYISKFGKFDETHVMGESEHAMINKLRGSPCLILIPDEESFFLSSGKEASNFRRKRPPVPTKDTEKHTRRSIGKAVHAGIDRAAIRAISCPPAWRKYQATLDGTADAVRLVMAIGLHERPPCRVVDLGCGNGYLLRVLQHLGHHAIGIDINPPHIREAQAILGVDSITHNLDSDPALPRLLGEVDVMLGMAIGWNWGPERYFEWIAALVEGVADDGMIAIDWNFGGSDCLLSNHGGLVGGIDRVTKTHRQGQLLIVSIGKGKGQA